MCYNQILTYHFIKMNENKKIIFACDYRGCELKKELFAYAKELKLEVCDIGIEEGSLIDYIDITKSLVSHLENENAFGVIVCGSGQGVAMAANRSNKMRAAVCRTVEDCIAVRQKLNANILCLGSKQTGSILAKECLNAFISNDFKGGRHVQCVAKLESSFTTHTYSGINIIVRGLVIIKDQILLSRPTKMNTKFSSDFYFLPGGHVEYLESPQDALRREFMEEMNVKIEELKFVDLIEAKWDREGHMYHELNLLYKVHASDLNLRHPPQSTDAFLEFLWCQLNKIDEYNLLPESIILVIKNTAS